MNQPANPYAPPPGAPPAPQQMQHGVQLDPALAAEMARLQAASAMRQRAGSGEKRDDEWYTPNRPDEKAVGRTAESYVLALPISMVTPGALPFAMTAQHHIVVRGKESSVICPKRDAQIRDPEGRNGPPPSCPICDAAEFCFGMMYKYEKGTAEGEMWKQRGKDLNPRDRCFMNVFDLDNVQTHWKVDKESGTAGPVAKIWGFGPEIMKKLMAIAGEVGPFWHPSAFTRLKILCTRTGTEQRNIKYDVTITMPIAGMQIPQGYEGALQQLVDIDYYRRVRPVAELAEFVPGYARQGGDAAPSTMAPPPAVPNPYGAPPAMPPPPSAYGPPPGYGQPPAQPQYAPPGYGQPPAQPQYAPPGAPPPGYGTAPPPQYAQPPAAPQYAPPSGYGPPPGAPPSGYGPPPAAPQYAPPPAYGPPPGYPAPEQPPPPAQHYAPPPMPSAPPSAPPAQPQYAPPPVAGYPPPPPAGPAYAPPQPPQMAAPPSGPAPWENQAPPQAPAPQQQYAPPPGMPPMPGLPPVPSSAPPASPPPAPAASGMPALPPLPPLPPR